MDALGVKEHELHMTAAGMNHFTCVPDCGGVLLRSQLDIPPVLRYGRREDFAVDLGAQIIVLGCRHKALAQASGDAGESQDQK